MDRRIFKNVCALAIGLLAIVFVTTEGAAARASGSARVIAHLGDENLRVYTYRPDNCSRLSLLLVFHGHARDASSYRDDAREIADRACFVVYAPLFKSDRFPTWSYQRGGIVKADRVLSAENWTVNLVSELVVWARQREGDPQMPIVLFGHSAGAQFLSRVAAYAFPEGVTRVVLSNASTYVLPLGQEEAPYGFGGLFKGRELTDKLRQYLESPITIFLGTEDTDENDAELTQNEEALRQGKNRRERGEHVFESAARLAKDLSWDFNWELVYAEGVGHSSLGMLEAAEVLEALGLESRSTEPGQTAN